MNIPKYLYQNYNDLFFLHYFFFFLFLYFIHEKFPFIIKFSLQLKADVASHTKLHSKRRYER